MNKSRFLSKLSSATAFRSYLFVRNNHWEPYQIHAVLLTFNNLPIEFLVGTHTIFSEIPI